MLETLTNPWTIGIGTTMIAGLILYYMFGIGKEKWVEIGKGGRGGNASAVGSNNTAIGGKGGEGGLMGKGGDGGNARVLGDNCFVMGGEGGGSGQKNRGGRGGRGPLHIFMEDYPEKFKEISENFGITESMAKRIGKGGDGGSVKQN